MSEKTGLIGLAATMLHFLRPPRMLENGDRSNVEKVQLYEVRVRRWRDSVWFALVGIILVLGSVIALAWGMTPVFAGFEHKATADASQSLLARRMETVEQHLIEQSLIAAKQGQCSSNAKQYFTQRLDDLRLEYKRIVGSDWAEPSCDEVAQ